MPDEQLLELNPSPFCSCPAGVGLRHVTEGRAASWAAWRKETNERNAAIKAEAKSQIFIDSGIPDRFKGFDLTTFQMRYGEPEKTEAIKAAKEYLSAGKLVKGRGPSGQDRGFYHGMWLYGPFGVGKTSILAGVFAPLVERLGGGLWLPYLSFLDQVRQGISDNTATALKQAAMLTPVLMLEDMGSMGRELETAYTQEVLWQIVYHRNAHLLPTFVSSNLDMYAIKAHFGQIGEGFTQRLAESLKFIAVDGSRIRDK